MFGNSTSYESRSATHDVPVIVYGTAWCGQTMRIRRYLDRAGIPYRYVDLERDPNAAAQVRWWTGGYVSHPTLSIGGEILIEPSMSELQWALSRSGLR